MRKMIKFIVFLATAVLADISVDFDPAGGLIIRCETEGDEGLSLVNGKLQLNYGVMCPAVPAMLKSVSCPSTNSLVAVTWPNPEEGLMKGWSCISRGNDSTVYKQRDDELNPLLGEIQLVPHALGTDNEFLSLGCKMKITNMPPRIYDGPVRRAFIEGSDGTFVGGDVFGRSGYGSLVPTCGRRLGLVESKYETPSRPVLDCYPTTQPLYIQSNSYARPVPDFAAFIPRRDKMFRPHGGFEVNLLSIFMLSSTLSIRSYMIPEGVYDTIAIKLLDVEDISLTTLNSDHSYDVLPTAQFAQIVSLMLPKIKNLIRVDVIIHHYKTFTYSCPVKSENTSLYLFADSRCIKSGGPGRVVGSVAKTGCGSYDNVTLHEFDNDVTVYERCEPVFKKAVCLTTGTIQDMTVKIVNPVTTKQTDTRFIQRGSFQIMHNDSCGMMRVGDAVYEINRQVKEFFWRNALLDGNPSAMTGKSFLPPMQCRQKLGTCSGERDVLVTAKIPIDRLSWDTTFRCGMFDMESAVTKWSDIYADLACAGDKPFVEGLMIGSVPYIKHASKNDYRFTIHCSGIPEKCVKNGAGKTATLKYGLGFFPILMDGVGFRTRGAEVVEYLGSLSCSAFGKNNTLPVVRLLDSVNPCEPRFRARVIKEGDVYSTVFVYKRDVGCARLGAVSLRYTGKEFLNQTHGVFSISPLEDEYVISHRLDEKSVDQFAYTGLTVDAIFYDMDNKPFYQRSFRFVAGQTGIPCENFNGNDSVVIASKTNDAGRVTITCNDLSGNFPGCDHVTDKRGKFMYVLEYAAFNWLEDSPSALSAWIKMATYHGEYNGTVTWGHTSSMVGKSVMYTDPRYTILKHTLEKEDIKRLIGNEDLLAYRCTKIGTGYNTLDYIVDYKSAAILNEDNRELLFYKSSTLKKTTTPPPMSTRESVTLTTPIEEKKKEEEEEATVGRFRVLDFVIIIGLSSFTLVMVGLVVWLSLTTTRPGKKLYRAVNPEIRA